MNTTTSPTLGQRLQAARLARGWSVERLAAETAVSVEQIEWAERCMIPARSGSVRRMSAQASLRLALGRSTLALGVSLASLFEEVEK